MLEAKKMTINKIEVEFPCGLKIKLNTKSVWLHEVHTFDDVTECPLHGKKCFQKIGRKK